MCNQQNTLQKLLLQFNNQISARKEPLMGKNIIMKTLVMHNITIKKQSKTKPFNNYNDTCKNANVK